MGSPWEEKTRRLIACVEWFCLLGIVASRGAVGVPDVNETHYLTKAKHFWQPDWLPHDFYLASADTHVAFYAVIGWLSLFLCLDTVAWIGRVFTWCLLASSWQMLSRSLLPYRFVSCLSLGLFLFILPQTSQAGEWIVRGVEAKVFGYAAVFAGLAAIFSDRWNLGLTFLGVATLFHTLIGGWSLIAVTPIWILSHRSPKIDSLWPGLLTVLLLTTVSLWPHLANWQAIAERSADDAYAIMVYQRAPHHLSYFQFPLILRVQWLLGLSACGSLVFYLYVNSTLRAVVWPRLVRLFCFVLGGVCIALCGIAVSINYPSGSDQAASWLRYYWFRLGDVVVPLGIAFALSAILLQNLTKRWGIVLLSCLLLLMAGDSLKRGLNFWYSDYPASFQLGDIRHYRAWVETTRWIQEHTPEGAIFLTPAYGQDFIWRTNRSSVVTWKDVPQDADGILQWQERMDTVFGDSDDSNYSMLASRPLEDLLHAAKKYDADFLVTRPYPHVDQQIVFQNRYFAVYRINNR